MKEAERNIFVIVNGLGPCVHLKGHVSQHFVIGCMRFEYLGATAECSDEEFITECESRGWKCMVMNGSVCIHGRHHQVIIAPNGKIFIDGHPYKIQEQINKQRIKDEKLSVKKRNENREEMITKLGYSYSDRNG